jgi:ribosomal protein S9
VVDDCYQCGRRKSAIALGRLRPDTQVQIWINAEPSKGFKTVKIEVAVSKLRIGDRWGQTGVDCHMPQCSTAAGVLAQVSVQDQDGFRSLALIRYH